MLGHKLNNSCSIKEMMRCVERNMVRNLVVCDFCIKIHTFSLINNEESMLNGYGLLLSKQRPFVVGN
mgnify:CR=1 FL=1